MIIIILSVADLRGGSGESGPLSNNDEFFRTYLCISNISNQCNE